MRNLLDFLVRAGAWLLFGFYVTVSCVLLFTSNSFQHHVYLTTAGRMASSIYSTTNGIKGYFSLRDINQDLQRRNADLEAEVLSLRHSLQEARLDMMADTLGPYPLPSRHTFILAPVINNSIHRAHNYITIERGALDGIEPEMGVVNENGVVGIVNIVGDHTARVISLLNPHLQISCKVKGSEHVGTLVWDGEDSRYALLTELPRHAVFNQGDTIVTSGFSSAFPAGVPVGAIEESKPDHDTNFLSLKIRLFTDFSTLSTVRVVTDRLSGELRRVENDPE